MARGPPIMPPCCEMASHEIDGVCVLRQGYDVVLYGDSITENWRGTSAGELWKWSNGTLDSRFVGGDMKSVFLTAFQKYRTGVMAVAGVQSCTTLFTLSCQVCDSTQRKTHFAAVKSGISCPCS